MSEHIINEIARERKNQKINLARAEALWSLMDNPDFQLVFRDYYQGLYLQRLVKDDLALAAADQVKQSAVDKIKAIGLFDHFIKQVDREGAYARQFMLASDEELILAYEEQE